MSIDRTNADTYFTDHACTAEWFAFSVENRDGAIVAAKRLLSRGLGRAMSENEAPYEYGHIARDEYAVYEQALYILTTSRVGDGGTGAPYPVAMPQTQEQGTKRPWLYSAAALRWLGWLGASTVRG